MAQRLRTIPGFGPTGTAELAGEIGALKRFDNEASLDHSSGLQRRGKRSKCVNSRCQAALMTCVARHLTCVPESRAFYERKQGRRQTP